MMTVCVVRLGIAMVPGELFFCAQLAFFVPTKACTISKSISKTP
jgi:hypothetical protein